MQTMTAERFGKKFVDDPMPFDAALAREGLGHDIDPEMRFPTLPRPGMPGVKMRLVADRDSIRPQRGRYRFLNPSR